MKNVGEIERVASGLAGAALLAKGISHRGPAGWLVALLGGGLVYRGLSGRCRMYEALGISTAAPPHHGKISVPGNRGIKVERSIQVHRSPEELYRTWRNFENLPHFMKHLESVRVLDPVRSHWVARAPGGKTVEWDAEIINEHENEMIAWRSLEGADVDNAGTVRFRPIDGGTEVRVSLEYDPPGGGLGAAFARYFHEEPGEQIEKDLLRFKQMMETAG
jgi:uncharacterized membrane protein